MKPTVRNVFDPTRTRVLLELLTEELASRSSALVALAGRPAGPDDAAAAVAALADALDRIRTAETHLAGT